MGLSNATDTELDEILYPELNEFIANQVYLPPQNADENSSEEESDQSLGAKCTATLNN